MKKLLKVVLALTLVLVIVLGIAVGVLFSVYPLSPKVEIKSEKERLKVTDELLVGSFNTAAPWGNILNGTFTSRRACLFAQQINNIMPDTLGVQEMNTDWVSKMETLLPQYSYYGVKRGGDAKEATSEMSGIFYLKDKFELLESNTFWISNTPETESHFEGAGCNRVCSYVVLKNKQTGKVIAHFNTHFDNVSEEAQNLGGRLISQYAEKICEKYEEIPVVVTGDFNQYSDGLSCKALEEKGFLNVGKYLGKDNLLTWNDWSRDKDGQPIDFIFINNKLNPQNYDVIYYDDVKSNVSDHYMIVSELQFN